MTAIKNLIHSWFGSEKIDLKLHGESEKKRGASKGKVVLVVEELKWKKRIKGQNLLNYESYNS